MMHSSYHTSPYPNREPMVPKYLGNQYILEFYNCQGAVLDDVGRLQEIMQQAAVEAGATVVQEFFHKFSPQGISGTLVLAESHLNIHTWPEYGFAAVDLFTCGDDLTPDKAQRYLRQALEAEHTVLHSVKRGADIQQYSTPK